MKKTIIWELGISLIVLVGFLVFFSSPVSAHDNAGNSCIHILNQWVACCGSNYCSGNDSVNDCETCWIDGGGGHSGCGGATETHEANSPSCVAGCNDNGIQDNGEAGVDCGGGGCEDCPSSCGVPVGSSCSTCDTQWCPIGGSVCASGNKYCVYSAGGNYCGGCTEEVNNCASCPTPTPAPTAVPGCDFSACGAGGCTSDKRYVS